MAEETVIPEQTQPTPYIDKVYSALKDNLSGFNKTPEQFKEAMKDSTYASKAYGALKDNLNGFDKTPDDFYQQVGIKKKASTTDSQPISKIGGLQDLNSLKSKSLQPERYSMVTDPTLRQQLLDRDNTAPQQNTSVRGWRTVKPVATSSKVAIPTMQVEQAEYNPNEGSWENTLPHVGKAITQAITKPLSSVAKIIRDQQGPAALPLYNEKGELTAYGKQADEGKGGLFGGKGGVLDHDYLGRLIIGLDAYNAESDKDAYKNGLPHTFAGNTASGIIDIAPDIATTALLPEGKVAEVAGYLGKLKSAVWNPFTKLMIAKGGLQGYDEAEQKGASKEDAQKQAIVGAFKGGKQGVEAGLLGGVAGEISSGAFKQISKLGLFKDGRYTKAGLDALSDAAVFGAAPVATNLVQGKPFDKDEFQKGIGIGLTFGLSKATKTFRQYAETDTHIDEVLQDRQASATRNFMMAAPEAILDAYHMPDSAGDLNARAVEQAHLAKNEPDIKKRSEHAVAASTFAKASDVKGTVDAILHDPDGFLKSIEESELPDDQKQVISQKVSQIHDLLKTETPTPSFNPLQPEAPNEQETNQANQNYVSQTPQANETGVPENAGKGIIAENPITDEQRKSQNDETDAKVKAFQEKFPDRHVDPLEDLPESVVRTFDRVDHDLPTDPVAVNEASDWLYNKYKQLTAMKNSDTRLLTTEQIDALQQQLGEDITTLENHKQKYHGDNEQTGETKGQSTEQAIGGSDQNTTNQNKIENGKNDEMGEQPSGQESGQSGNGSNEENSSQESKASQEKVTLSGEVNASPDNLPKDEQPANKRGTEQTDEPVQSTQTKEKKNKVAEAIKNENTKAKAEEAGIQLDDHVGEKRTKDKVDKEAKDELKKGYDSHELVQRILHEGHKASDTEVAILAKHTETVEKRYKDITKQLESDGATMSKKEFDDLSNEQSQLANDYQDALNANVKTGTETARALSARRFEVKNDFSLGQMIKNKRASNNGEKLTKEQVEEVTKRFSEIEEANKKLQDRVEKLEKDNARIKAEKTIKRIQEGEARLKKKAVTKEALADERKQIAQEFSAKLKAMRQSGALNSVGKATAEFLQAAAPYVAKMVRNLALEGVTEIKDVIGRVKEELDLQDLSDREVTDLIAGTYNEVKPTKKELSEKIADLRMQAKLMTLIEDAENGLKKAKGTKAESKASDRVKELRQRLNELTRDDVSLEQSKTATKKRITELERRIAENDFSKPQPTVKPDAELLNLRRKADKLKHEYQVELAKDELANRTKIEKLKDNILNIASLPRALKASLDFSAVLRQGLFASAGHPKQAFTAFKEMFRQTASEERYNNWIADLKHSPVYDLMQKSDLYLSDKSDPKLLAREEQFTSNLADKIPGIGKLIAASERAYTGYLNVLRAGVFTSEAQNLVRKGYTFENNPEQFKALAKVVNVLTGRGDIPEFLGGAQPKILSAALFSPRFMAARIQTLYLWADPRLPKEAKILAAKDIGATLASGAVIMSLAALAGYKVQLDPRSSNFLKIQDKQRNGTTFYDIMGGLPQYIRFLSQQLSGQKIPSNDRGIITLGSKKYGSPTRLTEAARFIRGKFSPVVGSATNLLEGKDVIGQPYHFWPNVPQEFVPLPFSDVQEAYKVGGITGGLKAFLPSQFGIGVSSYDPNQGK